MSDNGHGNGHANSDVQARTREMIIADLTTVPAMPSSITRVLSMLQDPEVEIRDLVDAIELDPGLTANLLRWANSAYFSSRMEITSVRDASVRLGLKRMNQLIITSVVAPIVGKKIQGYDLPPGSLLEHSVATAIGTNALAEQLRIELPDYAYTAGLLHDIGKIVLGNFIKVKAEPIVNLARQEGISFVEAERLVLGIDHAEVGSILLERWNIPNVIAQVVRWHHAPESFEDAQRVLDVVHVADCFSTQSGLGVGIDGLRYQPCEASVDRLHLTPRLVESAMGNMLQKLTFVRDVIDETAGAAAK